MLRSDSHKFFLGFSLGGRRGRRRGVGLHGDEEIVRFQWRGRTALLEELRRSCRTRDKVKSPFGTQPRAISHEVLSSFSTPSRQRILNIYSDQFVSYSQVFVALLLGRDQKGGCPREAGAEAWERAGPEEECT